MTVTKKKFKAEAKPSIEHDTQTEVAQLRSQIERYESFFGELDSFISFVRDEKSALKEATAAEAEA
jgi:cob(I)alamin adenosyltransferase